MLEYNETEMRELAVSERNKNIMISAGAGSGKTTVLTDRLISRVRDGRESVNDFLVVTFMKAAAQDVKKKLTDKLADALAANPGDKHLERQLALVPQANITTISSFCLSLVKENFSRLGIPARVRILDETEEDMLLSSVCDDLITECYAKGEDAFFLLVDNFSGTKSDDTLSSDMCALYKNLRVMVDPNGFLSKYVKNLYEEAEVCENKGFFETDIGKSAREYIIRDYGKVLKEIKDFIEEICTYVTDDCYNVFDSLVKNTESVIAAAKTNYVNYVQAAATVTSVGRLSKPTDDKDKNDHISASKRKLSEKLTALNKKYSRGDENFLSREIRAIADVTSSVLAFITELDKKYTAAKKELGALDYSDFELKAFKLLASEDENGNYIPTELCIKKRSAFKEILIDEYQDVNPMQDEIFKLLSGGSNRFMVGDVKQSIYRFRNAYPEIFLGYKENYPDILPNTPQENARIFFRKNFRCARPIIDYVNLVFDKFTSGTDYEKEYKDELLVYGQLEEYNKYPVRVAIAEKEEKTDELSAAEITENARRAEARYIAKTIYDLVESGTVKKDGHLLKYSDCAVMLGAMKGYSLPYEKAFAEYGIPFKSETTVDFMENPSVILAIAALKAIDDPTDDISLCALMRSPICSFSSEELYKIRLHSLNTPFYAAVSKTSVPPGTKIKSGRYKFKTSRGEKGLCLRCREFLIRLTDWRHESAGVPCREFLKSFFVSSGLYNICVAGGNRESLLMLYEYANKYETSAYLGLSGFMDYLAKLDRSDRKLGDVAHAGEKDAVSFITVHKSKGLQFSVCFLAGIDKKFRLGDTKRRITLSRRKGISFKLRNRELMTYKDTYLRIIAQEDEKKDIIGEELRKLYVALTRAVEWLFVTGIAENGYAEKEPAREAKSWLDVILFADSFGEQTFYDKVTLKPVKDKDIFLSPAAENKYTPTEDMLKAASFVYPYAEDTENKNKISVSELRKGLLEDDEYNRNSLKISRSRVETKPIFAEEDGIRPEEIGIANHLFMQFCDFANVENNGTVAEAERLLKKGMYTEKQFRMLDHASLKRFFESELYKRIRSSDKVYREKRFSVIDDALGAKETVVQGVIDCFFLESDGSYTVVDYKTDRVSEESVLIDRHSLQLEYYCRAVEKITGTPVKKACLWSFCLGKEVTLR